MFSCMLRAYDWSGPDADPLDNYARRSASSEYAVYNILIDRLTYIYVLNKYIYSSGASARGRYVHIRRISLATLLTQFFGSQHLIFTTGPRIYTPNTATETLFFIGLFFFLRLLLFIQCFFFFIVVKNNMMQ